MLHHSSATGMKIDKRISTGQTRTIPEENSENRKWIGQQTAALEGARLWPPKISDLGFCAENVLYRLCMQREAQICCRSTYQRYKRDRIPHTGSSTNRKWNRKSNRKCYKRKPLMHFKPEIAVILTCRPTHWKGLYINGLQSVQYGLTPNVLFWLLFTSVRFLRHFM